MNGTFSGVLEYAGGVRRGSDHKSFIFDGIVNGAIQYEISSKGIGAITTVKSINLTPFKKVTFVYSASAGYNFKDYAMIYAIILDTNKKVIKSWSSNYSIMDYGNKGFENWGYSWDISAINQQAFITIWVSLSQNKFITFRISSIKFTV